VPNKIGVQSGRSRRKRQGISRSDAAKQVTGTGTCGADAGTLGAGTGTCGACIGTRGADFGTRGAYTGTRGTCRGTHGVNSGRRVVFSLRAWVGHCLPWCRRRTRQGSVGGTRARVRRRVRQSGVRRRRGRCWRRGLGGGLGMMAIEQGHVVAGGALVVARVQLATGFVEDLQAESRGRRRALLAGARRGRRGTRPGFRQLLYSPFLA
jgi:hypothetical protein